MILPKITSKQQEILLYLYKFRFLNTNQLQTIFKHKDPQRIKTWLRDLREKGYVTMDYNRKTFGENTKPAVYSLATKARHILKESKQCDLTVLNKIYKEKKRTKKFINRCIALADIYLFFLSQQKEKEELHFFTESNLARYDYFPDPLPSAYIAVKTKNLTRRYFLDFFDDFTPPFVIRNRVKTYFNYSNNGSWEANANNEPLPSILFICPTVSVKKHIYYYTKSLFEKNYEEKFSLFLTTKETVKYNKDNTIWEKVEI